MILAAALLASQPVPPAAEAPLFASNAPLPVVIQGPINVIVRDMGSPSPRPATLTAGGETLTVDLQQRGITRRQRDVCTFPPLRISFRPWPTSGMFAGQRRLKLVTHCRPAEGHQQHVFLEYAAYRLYNQLTPLSYRVRPLQIDYRQPDGRSIVQRFGFVIEDEYGVARRNGLRHFQAPDRVPAAQLSAAESARAALFNYMIGNLDWSMRAGPEGDGCCHNFRLLDRGGARPFVPLPYDFDFSGLVDAPYATPPEAIPMRNVRARLYRGYCAHNREALAAAAEMRARRPQLEAVFDELPGLSAGSRRKALAYLAGFFADIADDATMNERLLKRCVG